MFNEGKMPVVKAGEEQTNKEGKEHSKKNIVLMTGTQMERPLRHLAGLIKEYANDRYEVDILNLGTPAGVYENKDGGYPEELKREVIDFLIEKKPRILGINMIDYGVERLSTLIKEISQNDTIHQNGTKIIVGGPFAIEHSKRCLEIEGVDIVCYSKAWSFVDMLDACETDELENISGLMIKIDSSEKDGIQYIETPPPKLCITISDQPLPDESLERTHFIYDGQLVNVKESGGAFPVEHHQVPHKHTGVLVTSEGCPNDCQFCSITAQRETMKNQVIHFFSKQDVAGGGHSSVDVPPEYKMPKVRFLDARKAVDLIKNYITENPKTEYVLFNDNDFFARSVKKIEEFAKLYKEEIGLPFYCQGSPNTISEEKIKFLVESGMDTLDTGVQGSQRANERAGYNRICTDENVLNVARSVALELEKRNEYGVVIEDGLKVAFDFINGNDVHTREDMISTIALTKSITQSIEQITEGTGSWNLAIHNLTLDHDRDLAKRYREIKERDKESVGEVEDSDYHNATVEAFYRLSEAYLNIVLQWMAGVHDQVRSGQLPRKTTDFVALIKDVLEDHPEFLSLIKQKEYLLTDTVDLLTDPDVCVYLSNKLNPEVKNVLIEISAKLPEIQYSYQRPDRYDYDYSWAEKQLQE